MAIVSDVALVREALCLQFGRDPRIAVAGGSGLDEPLPRTADARAVDVVIIDFGSTGALGCVERIRLLPERPRLIGVAIGKSRTTLSGWAEAGVCGFIEDDGTVDDVVRAVLLVAKGNFCCSPRAAASIVSGLIDRDRASLPRDIRARLTPREAEILCDLARGATNKEIARRLGISGATVKNHVHHLFEKLDVRRRAQAAALLHPPLA